MEKLQYNFRYPIYPNDSKFRGYAWDELKYIFAKKVAELVLDTNRDATVDLILEEFQSNRQKN